MKSLLSLCIQRFQTWASLGRPAWQNDNRYSSDGKISIKDFKLELILFYLLDALKIFFLPNSFFLPVHHTIMSTKLIWNSSIHLAHGITAQWENVYEVAHADIKKLNKYLCIHTFSPMIMGIKWSSKLNSATGIIIVHLRTVNVVSRVGMYSSNDATSSKLGIVLFPSTVSTISQDYVCWTKIYKMSPTAAVSEMVRD